MNAPGLTDEEVTLLRGVFTRHPEVLAVRLFGSRAKGTHSASSDVDLALTGPATSLQIAAIAGELDELPLPYTFDVCSDAPISHAPLREHINRVGIPIYRRREETLDAHDASEARGTAPTLAAEKVTP